MNEAETRAEHIDPGVSLDRARETWQKHGRSQKWIQQRMSGQETRNKLTDYWTDHDIKKAGEFAILTNIIHQEWSGVNVKAHGISRCPCPPDRCRRTVVVMAGWIKVVPARLPIFSPLVPSAA